MESIMPTDRDTCYVCGCYLESWNRNEHHIFYGTANRKVSEREGLKVYLCRECHTQGRYSVHRNPNKGADKTLKMDAQTLWEQRYINAHPNEENAEKAAREAFRTLFGRSYL